MCSRCFAGRYQTAVLAVASTASPTGSPKSSVKPASSRHPENGQRLAANADHPLGISVSLQGEHKQFIGNGNSSAHHLGERYFFCLTCNRTGRRIFKSATGKTDVSFDI